MSDALHDTGHRGHRGSIPNPTGFSQFTATVAVIVLVIALLAGAVQLQAARERMYPRPDAEDAAMYVQSGTAVRRLSGAFTAVAADVYWIRAIQYYGSTKQRVEAQARLGPEPPPLLAAPIPGDFRLLYPMLDVTTDLDPQFEIAYRFGAVFLAEAYPRGAGRPDLAASLLEKGLRAQPDKWQYMEDIGFVYYWYVHDYRAAAAWFQKGGDLPGAPWWLRSLAATTLAQGGDRRSSRMMWEAIRESAQIDWLRHDAERLLQQLRALDDIDALQPRVDAYASRSAGPPSDWLPLVRARALPGVPLDPTGAPYVLTIVDHHARVTLSEASTLRPLPEEPQGIMPAVRPLS